MMGGNAIEGSDCWASAESGVRRVTFATEEIRSWYIRRRAPPHDPPTHSLPSCHHLRMLSTATLASLLTSSLAPSASTAKTSFSSSAGACRLSTWLRTM